MATWEQGGNLGGLLGSIGQNNSNAPRASDINTTLDYIRNNNDLQRSGANNIGLTALRGIGEVKQGLTQNEAAQQAKDFQSAYGAAYASGDRNAMRQLAAKYPGQMAEVQKGMGFIDDDQRATVGNLAASARLAASNPETFSKWLQSNATDLSRIGVDPQSVAQMYQQNPQGFGEFADHLGLAAVGPDKYFDIQDKMIGRQIDQGKLSEQIRSNQAGESLQSRGQDIQIRGQNISAQNAALDRQIKQAELQDKVLDRQIARETNVTKLEELKLKQRDAQDRAQQARSDKQATAQGAVDTFTTALDSLDTITNSPGLSKAVGVRSAFPTIPGTDAANFESQLDTFKAQTFLPMVASLKGMGALSDAEGKKLSEAVGALNPKMSEAEFRKSAAKIQNQLQSKLGNIKKQFNYQEPPPQQVSQQQAAPNQPQQQPASQQQAGYSSLWGD